MGIRFAPLHLPWERRKQTAAVLAFIPLQLWGLVASFLLFVNPLTFPILLAYFIWIGWFDHKSARDGTRKSDAVRRARIFEHIVAYFPIEMIKTADLDPSKHYLFGYHPHGILSVGAFASFATEATGFSKKFPGIDCHLLVCAVRVCVGGAGGGGS